MNAFDSTVFDSTAFDSAATLASASSRGRTSERSWRDRLPLPLRADAAGLTWERFAAVYAPQNGPVRLGGWTVTALAAGRSAYEATFAVGAAIHTASAVANGPVAGMTAMLHDLGINLEILSFHQRELGVRGAARRGGTHATFLLCREGEQQKWALGTGQSATESTLRAMISGANRLDSAR
ncbi:alpha-isopropylmalate synthase regulatory domain-containing protein [Rhodococcus artemisiae]|uniref:Alpha-isopropylmalate synthase regulatory domain-containing protein n=1 Tax=Rhodococcus artemisiae TaxID=714159 RepID=A0ABU7L471_9NOCA|nr:alpha-isopropylmalate synthase regulatory domain-containing protein [Rhodococcus artemisiae]MEE2056298.1 alpha-isopropylmalate synthase regulatory domain-containing protein [Rhodococcus artemisiae]